MQRGKPGGQGMGPASRALSGSCAVAAKHSSRWRLRVYGLLLDSPRSPLLTSVAGAGRRAARATGTIAWTTWTPASTDHPDLIERSVRERDPDKAKARAATDVETARADLRKLDKEEDRLATLTIKGLLPQQKGGGHVGEAPGSQA